MSPVKNKPAVALVDAPLPGTDNGARFAVVLTMVYLLAGVVIAAHHEMFRDEMQPWLFARNSGSISELITNTRYEVSPRLWFLIVYLIGHVTSSSFAMQMLHLLIAACTVFLFARFSPFSKPQKVLFSFGYFTCYEFAAVCRYYALGVMLLTCFVLMIGGRSRRVLALAGILLLLSNSNSFGWLECCALSLTVACAWLVDRRTGNRWSVPAWQIGAGIAVVLAGLAIGAVHMLPMKDSPHNSGASLSLSVPRVARTLQNVSTGHLVLTYYAGEHSTGTARLVSKLFRGRVDATRCYKLIGAATSTLEVIFALALICFLLVCLARRPISLFAYVSMNAMLLTMFYVISAHTPGTLRNYGQFYFVTIAGLWMMRLEQPRTLRRAWLERASGWCECRSNGLLTGLLIVQMIAAIGAVGMDLRLPYSSARATAAYMRAKGLDALPIAADGFTTATVSGLYCLWREEMGSYTKYDSINARQTTPSRSALFSRARAFSAVRRSDIVLVLSYCLTSEECRAQGIESVRAFARGLRPDENYWIYLMRSARDMAGLDLVAQAMASACTHSRTWSPGPQVWRRRWPMSYADDWGRGREKASVLSNHDNGTVLLVPGGFPVSAT